MSFYNSTRIFHHGILLGLSLFLSTFAAVRQKDEFRNRSGCLSVHKHQQQRRAAAGCTGGVRVIKTYVLATSVCIT